MPAGVRVQVIGLDSLEAHLAAMAGSFEVAPRQVVIQLAAELKVLMLEEAPVRTGALRRGIRYRTLGTGAASYATFYSEADYTPFVIEGTRPHDIYPATAQALYWPGADHPVPFVHHPGSRPNPFPGRALERLEPAAEATLEATGEAIVQGRSA